MDAIAAGFKDSEEGITEQYAQKQDGNFSKWCQYMESLGIEDVWLRDVPKEGRIGLLAGFEAAVRRNKFGKYKKPSLLHGSVSGAVTSVCTAFRENLMDDPSHEVPGIRLLILQR